MLRSRLAPRLFVVALFGVVAGALLFVRWVREEGLRRRGLQVIEFLAEQQTGEGVTLGDLAPQFWPPALRVTGLHVFDRDTTETIFAVDEAVLPVTIGWWGPQLGHVEVLRPDVHLRIEGGKLTAFEDRWRPSQQQLITRLPIGTFEVRGGRFRVSAPGLEVELDELDLVHRNGTQHDLSAALRIAHRELDERTWISAAGIAIRQTGVTIPDLHVSLPQGTLDASADIPLVGPILADLTAAVNLDALTPALPPPRKAHGTLDLDVHIEGDRNDPDVTATLWGRDLGWDTPGILTPLLTYEFGEVMAAIRANRREVILARVVAHPGSGEFHATGRIDLADRTLRNGTVTGIGISLHELLVGSDAAPTPWIDLGADLEVVWEGTLQPLNLQGTYDLAVSDLHVTDRPIRDPAALDMLRIPWAWSRGTIQLQKGGVVLDGVSSSPRNHGTMWVDVGFGPRGPLDLRFDLTTADLADFGPLKGVDMTGRGRVHGRIAGPFRGMSFEGHGDLVDFSVLGIPYADHLVAELRSPEMKTIELLDAQAVRGDTPYTGFFRMDFRPPVSMDTDVVIAPGRVEDLVGLFLDIEGIQGTLHGGALSLHGPLADLDGVGRVELGPTSLWGEGFETGSGIGYMDTGLFTLDDLHLSRRGGTEGLVLRGAVERQWKLDMELMADGFALQRLDTLAIAGLPLTGHVQGAARIGNTLFDPTPVGVLSVTDARYAGTDLADSLVSFRTAPGGEMSWDGLLLGGSATVRGVQQLFDDQEYRLEAVLSNVPAHIFYAQGADGSPVEALVSGAVEASGQFGENPTPVDLSAILDRVGIRWSGHELSNPIPWRITTDPTGFALRDVSLVGGLTQFRLSAEQRGSLDLSGEGLVDVDLLRALVPGLTRAEGVARVEVVSMGSRPSITTAVDITLDAPLLEHVTVPTPFEDALAQIRISESGIEVLEANGNVGGGTWTAGGSIASTSWHPERWDLRFGVRDAQMQWVESLPAARGDADLRLDGPTETLLLGGDVTVEEMDWSDRVDWEDWVVDWRETMLVDPAASYEGRPLFGFDIHIDADRTIRLRNNVAEAVASANLHVIGDTMRLGLVGTVQIEEDGLAILQDREFLIRRGHLLFDDPWTWDPQLDIDLEADIQGRDANYRVHYLVDGPFSDWRSTTDSDPPLPQSDVNALLWFGVTTEDLEEIGALPTALGQAAADLILTDFLVSGRGGDFGDDLPQLFDRLDLATGVDSRGEYSPDPRLVLEKRLADVGDLSWEFNLVRPEDNYVRLQRRIGGVWSLAGWYATLQRDRVLPIGGAYGVDVTARWESD